MIKRICPSALLAALLFCCYPAIADDIQDANKLFKQGQHDRALNKVDSILSSKPKDAQARFLKGLIFTEQGKTGEAIKIFTSLTEDYPDLPEPYNNLAVLYAGQGQYDKARVALEMAIRTHPSYATAHENLGDIYAKMASQAYDRALQLDKSNASTATKLELIKDLFGGSNRKAAAAATSHTVIASNGTVAPAEVSASNSKPAPTTPVVAPEPPKVSAAAAPSSQNASQDILKTVQEWASAWSAKNSKKYLSFYARDFKTPDGESRSAWEKQRHERIAAPKSIHVEVKDAKVKLTDNSHASVYFRQIYRASHLHTSSSKTLVFARSDDKWLILEEHTGK